MKRRIKALNQNIYAEMEVKDEKYILKQGSIIAKDYNETMPVMFIGMRKTVKIVDNVLKEDVEFGTPSGASTFVTGRADNGWTSWKDKEGKTLNEIIGK